jgi:hypothetical protein
VALYTVKVNLSEDDSARHMPTSEMKNASKDKVIEYLTALRRQRFPFQQPLLQGDIFWTYVNARRYFGSYRSALKEASIKIADDVVKHEFGYEIDWWQFRDEYIQREWLTVILRYLHKENVDVSPKGLKESPYFDIYTDAVNLLGNYDIALELADIPTMETWKDKTKYPKNKDVFEKAIGVYCCDDHNKRCGLLKDLGSAASREARPLSPEIGRRLAIVDGANIAFRNGKPSIDNVRLVDESLQAMGFERDSITFLFDAAFRYKVDRERFDRALAEDERYSIVPAREQADSHVLSLAYKYLRRDPASPPLIITNDKYDDFFEENPKLEELKKHKRGVTWTYVQKAPIAHISLLKPPRRPQQ